MPLIRIHDIGFIENLPKPILIKFSKLVNEGLLSYLQKQKSYQLKLRMI